MPVKNADSKGYKQCSQCGEHSIRVIDSRPSSEPGVFLRRRMRCKACNHAFTTHETIVRRAGLPADRTSAMQAVAFRDEFVALVDALIRDHFGLCGQALRVVRERLNDARPAGEDKSDEESL